MARKQFKAKLSLESEVFDNLGDLVAWAIQFALFWSRRPRPAKAAPVFGAADTYATARPFHQLSRRRPPIPRRVVGLKNVRAPQQSHPLTHPPPLRKEVRSGIKPLHEMSAAKLV